MTLIIFKNDNDNEVDIQIKMSSKIKKNSRLTII